MNSLYAMRRANGDWFAFDHLGYLRVPIYRNRNGAWDAHARNAGMLLFRPVLLDERLLADLSSSTTQGVDFWLNDSDAHHDPHKGQRLEIDGLKALFHELAGEEKPRHRY